MKIDFTLRYKKDLKNEDDFYATAGTEFFASGKGLSSLIGQIAEHLLFVVDRGQRPHANVTFGGVVRKFKLLFCLLVFLPESVHHTKLDDVKLYLSKSIGLIAKSIGNPEGIDLKQDTLITEILALAEAMGLPLNMDFPMIGFADKVTEFARIVHQQNKLLDFYIGLPHLQGEQLTLDVGTEHTGKNDAFFDKDHTRIFTPIRVADGDKKAWKAKMEKTYGLIFTKESFAEFKAQLEKYSYFDSPKVVALVRNVKKSGTNTIKIQIIKILKTSLDPKEQQMVLEFDQTAA